MLGDYILHFPLTDFAVSLLAVAALVDVATRVFARPHWTAAVDWMLFTGFVGVLAAVGSGLWLVTASAHPHDDTLSLHHWFAYSTLAVATIAVAARVLQQRIPKLAWLRTIALATAALLVSCTGFVGGKMSHGRVSGHSHDGMEHEPSGTSDPELGPAPVGQGSGSAVPSPLETPAGSGSAPSAPPTPHGDHAH